DAVAPTVTIDQAPGQPDPANGPAIVFAVRFDEPVLGFTAEDVSLTGSTVGGILAAAVAGSGADYTVSVTGMTGGGDLGATITAGAATDGAGNLSQAATSTDNTVQYDGIVPTVTIDQAATQADPTGVGPIIFDVHFSEPVIGFSADDVSFAGSSVGGTL